MSTHNSEDSPAMEPKQEPSASENQTGHNSQQNFVSPKKEGRFGNNRRQPPFHRQNNFNRRRMEDGNNGGNAQQGGHNHHDYQGGGSSRSQVDKVLDKLSSIAGPTHDLPPIDLTERRFSGRTRLYIGNLPGEITEEDITQIFQPYGETSELFINKEKNFGFVRVDYRVNAEKAKRELDGYLFKGKNLKVRFAPSNSTIKVKNLTNYVSNELLYHGFQIFGDIERAYILVDDRGKPTGEGIVEFARKGAALSAVRKCKENCYFLTSSLRPCVVESHEIIEDTDGYPEKQIMKKHQEYNQARSMGPRFAGPNSFENEYGQRWKQIHELYAQKQMALQKEFELEMEKLEAQMEFAKYEHETEMLRDQLRAREMDRDRQKHEWEMKERMAEEQRQRTEEQMRRQQEEMQSRMINQDEEMRRRQQENNLFVQAHQLTNILDQQEQAYDQMPTPVFEMNNDNNHPQGGHPEPKPFLNQYKRNNHRFEGRGDMGPNGPRNGGGRGHWVNNDNRRDDFQHNNSNNNKRRRY